MEQDFRSPLAPDVWLRDLFSSQAVQKGQVARRKRRDIERYAGMDLFLLELDRRGFQAVENAGQVVIFCNNEPVIPLTRPRNLAKISESHNPSILGTPPFSLKENGSWDWNRHLRKP